MIGPPTIIVLLWRILKDFKVFLKKFDCKAILREQEVQERAYEKDRLIDASWVSKKLQNAISLSLMNDELWIKLELYL